MKEHGLVKELTKWLELDEPYSRTKYNGVNDYLNNTIITLQQKIEVTTDPEERKYLQKRLANLINKDTRGDSEKAELPENILGKD